MTIDSTFPADYQVEELAELPASGALDYEMTGNWNRITNGGIMIAVTAMDGTCWTALVANALKSVPRAQEQTGFYSTPSLGTLLILARGAGYLIDVSKPDEWILLPECPIVQLVPDAGHNMIALATPTYVFALGADGVKWRTRRLALDDCRLGCLVDNRLIGGSNPSDSSEARPFSIDLESGLVDGGYE